MFQNPGKRIQTLASGFIAFALVVTCETGLAAEGFSKADLDFFENRIRPALAEHCLRCHGEDPDKLKGGLHLTSRAGILRGGDSGPALVPGKPEESLLVTALRWEDDLEMPPKAKLPHAVIADFEKWIAMGAPDPRDEGAGPGTREIDLVAGRMHWAFAPLDAPAAAGSGESAIDDFIDARLRAAGLKRSAEAEPRVLLRRLFLVLSGLPPTPEEQARFESAPHEEIVDYLLSSPRFGERWARHWLDVARFGESNGYEVDNRRRGAFQYRDWVIRAFNDDLPFDQFVRWQLAGDQLAPDDPDALIATGFVVAGTFSHPKPKAEELIGRYDEVDDMVSTVGSAFLAQTIGCARCHDHKFEPIPQADYYALAAAFAKTGRQRVTLTPQPNAGLKVEQLPEKRGKEPPLPEPPALAAYVANDHRPEPVHFLVRGDPKRPKQVAAPGFLQVADAGFNAESEHPRVALANWLTDVENGAGRLTARVIVNRLWHHHFGRGIVDTPNDFGVRGGAPSHPELLDFLANELIENGWRLKPVHRLILTSATWKQRSEGDAERAAVDVDNQLLWRQNVRRLEAEPLRDSLLAVAGLLDPTPFGEGSLDPNMRRRAIYFETKRTQLIPFLQTFNAPDALTSIGKRNTTTVAPQALLLMNEPLVRDCASGFADRLTGEADPIAAAYRIALGRPPSDEEHNEAAEYLKNASIEELCHALLISNEFVYVR